MKTSLAELLPKLPRGAPSGSGVPGAGEVESLSHGTMTLRLAGAGAGAGGAREPHLQDALYIVAAGTAEATLDGETMALAEGEAVFLRAGTVLSLGGTSDDFAAWVVLWGPAGGEAPAPDPSVFAAIDA